VKLVAQLVATLFLLAVPLPAMAQDSTKLINGVLKPTLVKKPKKYPYRAKFARAPGKVKAKLKQRAVTKNEITDDDQWFHKNILARPPEPIGENYRFVPAQTRWGDLKFFCSNDDARHVAVYVKATPRPDGNESYVYDKEYNYTAVLFGPDYVPLKLFVLEEFHPEILEITNARMVGMTLYFDINYNGYASIMKKKTGYLAALDLERAEILWVTKNLTSSWRGFLVSGDVIFTGYGFTDEPDFLYVLNRHSGKVLQKVKLKSAHSFIIVKDGALYVRAYDHDYVFDVK
jgi:hypothetical protein